MRLLSITLLLFIFIPVESGYGNELSCNSPPDRVYLLRHTEREDYSEQNSPLSKDGLQRANSLVQVIGNTPVQAIYTTRLKRTIETATPLATSKKIAIQQIPKNRIDSLMSKICNDNAGGTLVVVGHSGTIPKILSRFQLESNFPEYGELFIIDFKDEKTTLTKGWFGNK